MEVLYIINRNKDKSGVATCRFKEHHYSEVPKSFFE